MFSEKSYKWFFDFLSPSEGHMHGITRTLLSEKTPFQTLEIIETTNYGLCLVLDGKMQSSEVDEFIYHEALVHPAMLTHPNPKRIFIVGGGEGATLREVLKYRSVEEVVMVDIDEAVVNACKTHLPQWHQGAFEDSRVTLSFCDARKVLEETETDFDVIIIDISEPVEEGPAYLLYTKEFYEIAMKRLGPAGTISLQAGTTSTPYLLNFTAVSNTLRSVFPVVAPYQASIPSFGLPWGFVVASKMNDPQKISGEEIDRRLSERLTGVLQSYDGVTHQGQFLLPLHLREALSAQTLIIEDNQPLYVFA